MDVKTLCLGVLSMGDATGYEIRKVFEEAFSHFYVAGYGSIYPALSELTREGYATCQNIEQEKRPAKKVYRLTEAGMEAFRAALAETYPSHRIRSDFMVLMAYAHLLTPAKVQEALQQRLEDIESNLAHIDSCLGCGDNKHPEGPQFAAGYARAVLQAGRDFIEQHREELLHALEHKRKG